MADYVNGGLFWPFFGVFLRFLVILSIVSPKFSEFHKKVAIFARKTPNPPFTQSAIKRSQPRHLAHHHCKTKFRLFIIFSV